MSEYRVTKDGKLVLHMKNKPKPFQIECVNNVFDKICSGHNRISVLIPTGAGKTFIATMLVKKACTTYQKVVFIVEYNAIMQQCDNYFERLKVNNVSCQTVTHFLEAKENYDMVVLLDVRAALRVQFEDYFRNDERTIIVSLGTPIFATNEKSHTIDYSLNDLMIKTMKTQKEGQQLSRLLAYYTRMGEYHPLVYVTKDLIDIRDVFSASRDEQENLTQQLQLDKKKLSYDIFVLTKGIQDIQNTEDVHELKNIIQLLQRKMTYQTQLLASIGIPPDLIAEEFRKIEELREALSTSFYDAEKNIIESTMAQFETAVAESVTKLTKKIITLENLERYEDILKSLLSEKVWNMLSDMSRNLLITKVLDIEVSKRFYTWYSCVCYWL